MKTLIYVLASGIMLFFIYRCGDDKREGQIEAGHKEGVIEESRKVDSTRYDNPGNKNDVINNTTVPAHDYDDTVKNNKYRKGKS